MITDYCLFVFDFQLPILDTRLASYFPGFKAVNSFEPLTLPSSSWFLIAFLALRIR